MSWFSKGLKAVGHGVQHLANQKVLGVSVGGMLGAGGLGGLAAGELARGGNIKQNIIDDAKAGAKNTPAVLGGVQTLKTIGAPGFANATWYDPTTGASVPEGTPGAIRGPSTTANTEGGGTNGFLQFLRDHGGDIAKLGLGAGAAYEGVKNSQQATALNKDALAKLNAPLNPPDLNYVFNDPQNPFKKGRVPVVGRK